MLRPDPLNLWLWMLPFPAHPVHCGLGRGLCLGSPSYGCDIVDVVLAPYDTNVAGPLLASTAALLSAPLDLEFRTAVLPQGIGRRSKVDGKPAAIARIMRTYVCIYIYISIYICVCVCPVLVYTHAHTHNHTHSRLFFWLNRFWYECMGTWA